MISRFQLKNLQRIVELNVYIHIVYIQSPVTVTLPAVTDSKEIINKNKRTSKKIKNIFGVHLQQQ